MAMTKFKKSIFCGIILLLVMITGVTSAVSVAISPDNIDEGDTVTISFQDLNDNSTFALRMQSVIGIGNETSFQFEATNVNVPFSMSDPEVYVQAKPVNSAGLKATSGGSIKSIEYLADDTKIVDFSQGLDNLGAGSIESLRVFGETEAENQNIDISLQLEGIKTGPASGSISFGLKGIESGSAWIYIFVDGSEVTGKEIIIGEPPVTATPTPAPTSSGGSDSSHDSSDDPTSEPTSYTTAAPTEAVIKTDEASSMDGVATIFFREDAISGAVPEQVFITKVTPKEIPSDWQAVSEGYIISPSGAKFSPEATLTVRMNESISSQASVLRPFIVKYTGNDWTIMPSVVSGNAVKTDIDSTGQYALVIISSGGQTSSGSTADSGSFDYSGQQESPTQASGMSAALIPVFIGILGGILLLTGRRD
jgi:hypothetical protein